MTQVDSKDLKSKLLFAVSALDGRYAGEMVELGDLVSEGALMRYRIQVESAWVLHLSNIQEMKSKIVIPESLSAKLVNYAAGDVPVSMIESTKSYEKSTNHDVKAVEYAIADEFKKISGGEGLISWIHFGCTSEDINNLSYGLMLKYVRSQVLVPLMDKILNEISVLAHKYKDLAMLSRTHGQTATPTTLGKEMGVFWRRLSRQKDKLLQQAIEGKINGAVGNFNAHVAAFPEVDWSKVSKSFVTQRLNLEFNPLTTQIECHDSFVEFMEILRMFNMILLDFSRDMWGYISHGYFAQKVMSGEVGSSTMPHKVNPIFFENGEGNIGVANSLLSHFGEKLPVSRFQRDLSDSTVLRVTGTAIGHTVLAWKSILKGLARVEVDRVAVARDLDGAWEVLGEAVQTVLRKHGCANAYEQLKAATRGQARVTKEMIHDLIAKSSEIPEDEKKRLLILTPSTYVGLAAKLVTDHVGKSN